MDNVLPTTTYTNDSQSWLGSALGTDEADTITLKLDDARFVPATHWPGGFIPSGILLGKITASNLYVPYSNGGTADGADTAAGFLFTPVKIRTGATRASAAFLWLGEVVEANLPSGHGLDAPGKVDLAAKFRFV